MSDVLFEKLEDKIDQALETIELLRLQVEEYEEKNMALQSDNSALKSRQTQWENSLSTLLRKLEASDITAGSLETPKVELYENEYENEEEVVA